LETGGVSSRFEGMILTESLQSSKPFHQKAVCFLMVVALSGLVPLATQARQTSEQLDVHAQRVMIRGLTWLQNGYADRAAAVFSEGLKIHPENPALLSSMATAQQAMGDLGTARFYLDQALAIQPDQPALVSQDLDLALASGDREAASEAVDRMLALGSVDAHFILRHLTRLLDQGPGTLGPALATRGLELFPDDVDIVAGALRVFQERGEVDSAIRSAQRLVNLRGSFDDHLTLIGLYVQRGDWDEAASLAIPLMAREGEDPELVAILTDLDGRLPARDLGTEAGVTLTPSTPQSDPVVSGDSLGVFRAAWDSDPSNEEHLVALATFLIRTDRAREAALLVDEHVAEYPRNLGVWTLTMDAWLAAGDVDTALERSEDAILLFPGYPPIVLARARVLAATGESGQAVDLLDDLLERLDANSAEAQDARTLRNQLQQPG